MSTISTLSFRSRALHICNPLPLDFTRPFGYHSMAKSNEFNLCVSTIQPTHVFCITRQGIELHSFPTRNFALPVHTCVSFHPSPIHRWLFSLPLRLLFIAPHRGIPFFLLLPINVYFTVINHIHRYGHLDIKSFTSHAKAAPSRPCFASFMRIFTKHEWFLVQYHANSSPHHLNLTLCHQPCRPRYGLSYLLMLLCQPSYHDWLDSKTS
jgi:hypothetical protein